MHSNKLTHSLTCPHCFQESQMEIKAEIEMMQHEGQSHIKWQILLCSRCDLVHVWRYVTDTTPVFMEYKADGEPYFEYETYSTVIDPQLFREFSYLPHEIRQAYNSAQKLFLIDVNAYAVRIGQILELICDDKQIKKGHLIKRLAELAKQIDIMPPTIASIADSIRDLRNYGAHVKAHPVIRQDAIIMQKLCEIILEYVYEAPATLEQLKEQIAKKKNTSSK